MLHRDVISIIKAITEADVANDVVLVTNGTLLNKKLCDELLESGLTTLRISLNGLSDEDYWNYTSAKVNFENLVHNINYLHNRKKIRIYVKIMEYMVPTPELKQEFYSLFEPITDCIGIEHVMDLTDNIDYTAMKTEEGKNLHGAEKSNFVVCPIPFYAMTLHTSGKVCACCQSAIWERTPRLVFGDSNIESIVKIWNGEKRRSFLHNSLQRGRMVNSLCNKCDLCDVSSYGEDSLDDCREELLRKY